MDTRFKVTFIETYGENQHVVECPHFYESHDERYLLDEVKLTENSMLSVLFEAPTGYKLYIDGLDQLEENFVLEDERGMYIVPSETAYPLYDPFRNNKPYPFIPGTYLLTVSTPNDNVVEARAKVMAKRITEDQHHMMIEEIERAVKGLSSELSTRRNIYNETTLEIFGPRKIETYATILSNKEKIIHGLHAIETNRRYTVRKTYPVIPRAKAKKIDGKSLKYLMMHPEQQHTIQAPIATVTYDTLENRWMKSIVAFILRYVIEMKNAFHHPVTKHYNVHQAAQLEKEVSALQNKMMAFLNKRWIREIQENAVGQVPMAFFTVGTYSVFYTIYRSIKRKENQQTTAPKLQFHHKRSDVLYELWGYLKVIELLKENIDFQVTRNAFQVENNDKETTQSIDFIELKKEACTLRVFYDEPTPNRNEALGKYNTMFTMHNNRPDCRIDVWMRDQFKGSLIIDFKYRKKEYLWNDDYLMIDRPSKVMRQLSAYSTSMRSNSLLLNQKRTPLIDAQPVHEVWAVYPMKRDDSDSNYAPNDYAIRMIDLSPNSAKGHFEALLRQAILEIRDRV